MGKETEGRTPVIRRSSSVFPPSAKPRDTSGADVAMDEQLRQYDREQTVTRNKSGITELEKRKKDEQAKNAARITTDRGTAQSQQVYIDGRLRTVYNLFDADGKPVQVETLGGYRTDGETAPVTDGAGALTDGQRREVEARRGSRQATFDILNIDDVPQDSRFIMSVGEQLDEDGTRYYSTERGKAMVEDRMTKRRNPKSPNRMGATNMMTVGGGVTWFKNLSRNDPQAYAEMIDLLVGSNYLPKEAARKSVYSRDAGKAFAYAAADAAENNDAGSGDDLRTFLQKIQGDIESSDENAYVPANRTYVDPAALASTARSAAEDLLGRSLTDEEAARFQAKFRGAEDGYWDQIDAAGRAKTGARVADPNAVGQAEAFLRSPEYDAERSKQLVGGYMDSFKKLMGL